MVALMLECDELRCSVLCRSVRYAAIITTPTLFIRTQGLTLQPTREPRKSWETRSGVTLYAVKVVSRSI